MAYSVLLQYFPSFNASRNGFEMARKIGKQKLNRFFRIILHLVKK